MSSNRPAKPAGTVLRGMIAILAMAGALVGCTSTGTQGTVSLAEISNLAELNVLATNTDAILLYVPAAGAPAAPPPAAEMADAAWSGSGCGSGGGVSGGCGSGGCGACGSEDGK